MRSSVNIWGSIQTCRLPGPHYLPHRLTRHDCTVLVQYAPDDVALIHQRVIWIQHDSALLHVLSHIFLFLREISNSQHNVLLRAELCFII